MCTSYKAAIMRYLSGIKVDDPIWKLVSVAAKKSQNPHSIHFFISSEISFRTTFSELQMLVRCNCIRPSLSNKSILGCQYMPVLTWYSLKNGLIMLADLISKTVSADP